MKPDSTFNLTLSAALPSAAQPHATGDQDAFMEPLGGSLGFEREASAVSVTQLLKQFPGLPARVVVTLAILSLLERNVTPQRLCECGCGAFVTGKARLDSPACRKRVERERRAARANGARQFNLVWQLEIPVPLPK